LKTFGMVIVLNRRLASTKLLRIRFVETESDGSTEEEPGFQEFLRDPAMSGDAAEDEIKFLKSLRFKHNRPSPLYYYRELQSLRDPLHFRESSRALMHKRQDAGELEKQLHLDSRKRAIRRWAKNRNSFTDKPKPKSLLGPRPGRVDIN
jgi:hypothetical protein